MIIKIKKHQKNYSVIDNRPLNDFKMSFKARGIWGYLITKPENWEVSLDDLCRGEKDGVDSIRSGLKELVTLGYARLATKRGDKGSFVGKFYEIYEQPFAWKEEKNEDADMGKNPTSVKHRNREKPDMGKNPTSGKPDGRENRNTENPTLGKPAGDIINTEKEINTDIKINTELTNPVPDGTEKSNVGLNVDLEEKQKKIGTGGAGENSEYQGFMDVYFNFCKDLNETEPKIDGGDGKALKEIIAYCNRTKKEGKNGIDMWKYIMDVNVWRKLDPFTQKQINIKQINANLNSIITQIRNFANDGKSNNKSSSVTKGSLTPNGSPVKPPKNWAW